MTTDESLEHSPALASLPAGWSLAATPVAGLSLDACPAWDDGRGLSIFRSGTAQYEVEFSGIARFRVDCATRQVNVVQLAATLCDATLEHLLYDQLLPRLLDHEGSHAVHAAAVAVDGKAILLVGDSGRGKSTLAAALGKQGHVLLGDDGVTIEAGPEGPVLVRALYPSLRLLPDSIATLFGAGAATSLTASYTAKRRVADVARVTPALPCRALFVLAPQRREETGIKIEPLSPTAACMEVLRESFALDPSDTTQAARRLRQASLVAERVPAFELTYPRDYSRLPEVGRAMIEAAVGARE